VRLLRSRRFVHALIAVVIFLGVAGLYQLENAGRSARILSNWEYGFRDNTLTVGGRLNPPDSRLVFLGIDNASITLSSVDLQSFSRDISPDSPEYRALTLMTAQRPWSREVWALLCERLLRAGARAVIFDMVFEPPAPGDDAFQGVIRRFPDRLVLGMDFKAEMVGPGREALVWSTPSVTILPDASPEHPAVGYVALWGGFNGIIRSAQYQATLEQLQGGVPPDEGVKSAPSSLALRAASKLEPVNLSRPFQPHLFRFTGPPGTYPPVPLYQVFAYWQRNFGNGAAVRDKVVLVGAAGSITHDEFATPFGLMPGPEIHLNFINALLHHAFLRELPPWTSNVLIAFAVVAAWVLTVLGKKMWLRLAAFALLGAGYLFSVKLAYDHADTIVLAIPPVLAFGVAGLVSFVYDFTQVTLEKLRIRRTLEAYVSRDIVREVLDNPASYLSKLGGERENVALILTDLRGFTTMSEEMDSHQLVAQLNEYLSLMVDDIFSQRGSVDKFIGDAILAVWGHVKSEGAVRDVINAVEAALLMKESLRRLNDDWESRSFKTFQMGIGVNFGEVIFGNIGSSRKMEPTVIGDAVNVASRLEGLTKDYDRDLLIGEAAADLIGDSFKLQFVDRITMKGKTKPLRIYFVVSRGDATIEPQMASYLETYETAHVSYSAGSFKEAKVLFENCLKYWPDDSLARTYIQRCTTLMERPSEGIWTGPHVAEHN
jgi:adenylate cyclase